MFKRLIKRLINWLKDVTKNMEEAYELTYPDMELVSQFGKEVERRKKKNKEALLFKMTMLIISKCMEDTGEAPSMLTAKLMAEDMFEIGKIKGDINELNEFIYKEED